MKNKAAVEVLFLGTGTGVPSKDRGAPALIIRRDNEILLFDCGPGTLLKMAGAGLTYHDPDYLILTHFHVDHTCDVAALLFAARYELSKREKPLTIIGPRGLRNFLERLASLYPGQLESDNFTCSIHELPEGVFRGKKFQLRAFPVPHTSESNGYRFEDESGFIITLSGDSGFSDRLIEMGRGADILILECSFPAQVKGHLSPGEVARIASAAAPGKLFVTHMYPIAQSDAILNTIKETYKGETIVAQDFLRISLP